MMADVDLKVRIAIHARMLSVLAFRPKILFDFFAPVRSVLRSAFYKLEYLIFNRS